MIYCEMNEKLFGASSSQLRYTAALEVAQIDFPKVFSEKIADLECGLIVFPIITTPRIRDKIPRLVFQ